MTATVTPRDQIADRLRRKDVELRGGNPDGLLPWPQLAEPEQRRWSAMADEAYTAVTAAQEAAQVAST